MPTLKQCESFIQQVNSAIKNFSFYPKGHPYIIQPIKRSLDMIIAFHNEADEVHLAFIDGIVWTQNIPVPQEFMWDSLAETMRLYSKDALTIAKGIDFPEWERFITAMALPDNKEVLKPEKYSPHITFHSVKGEEKNVAQKIYAEAIDVVKNVIAEVRMGKIPKADEVKNVVGKIVDQVLKDKTTMVGLTLIKSYDDYLFHHSVNVTILCLALAESLKLSTDMLREMGTAAMLHDIGKVKIDPSVVLKPDKLTEEEWEQMKQHPVTGYDTLRQMEGLSEVVYKVALEHHMKYNMTGYPEVGKEYKLHPASMMLSICDTYDAMTTHRIYQRCHEPKEALEIMAKLAGTNFEPNYLRAFVKMLGIYPQGTLVKLSTGETAVVTRPNPNSPDEPVIKVIYNISGNKLEVPKVVDLSLHELDAETKQPILIVGTINPSWSDINISEYISG